MSAPCTPAAPAGRRRGRRRRRRAEAPPADDPLAEARDRAGARARLTRDLLEYAVVVGLLSLLIPPLAWVVGIVCGLALARDLMRKVVEPGLRQRWVEREVSRTLGRSGDARRREIEGEHARRIEEIAAGVAHEIRNPIAAAKSLVQQMGEDPASHDNVEYAHVALEELQRVERSISHLLRYAREEDLRVEPLCLAEVVRAALGGLRERIARAGVEVRIELDRPGRLRGDAEQLRRVVVNLVSNALDALEAAGPRAPRIELCLGESLAGDAVWLRVRDNGPGIPAEQAEQVFSPFHTGKPGGTGLGLALARKVARAHGGSLSLATAPGGGAELLLTLPVDGAAARHAETAP